jgi:hypothetical protein
MFLVGDHSNYREKRILQFLDGEPAIAVLLSAAHFEWTVSRALLFQSRTPNVILRDRLMRCTGLDAYKKAWQTELSHLKQYRSLPDIIDDWPSFREAFQLRHGLIHGRDTCTRNTATPKVEIILRSASDVREFCKDRKVDLHKRLPIRRNRTARAISARL